MIGESEILQYGIAGLWIITLLYDKVNFQTKLQKVIENNTKAIVANTENIKSCEKIKYFK